MGYPLFVAILSLVFAWQVGSDYRARRRPYQALWASALLMSAAASIGYILAVQFASEWGFRVYYVFGALLVAPYMGMGSLFLVLPRSAARLALWCVHVLAILGTYLLWQAAINPSEFAQLAGTSGRGVLVPGAWLPMVIVMNLFGTAAVVGVAFYSAIRSLVQRKDGRFVLGNAAIGAGILLIAVSGSAVRWMPTWDGAFWGTMAVGWMVAYTGFRVVTVAAEARALTQARGPETAGA